MLQLGGCRRNEPDNEPAEAVKLSMERPNIPVRKWNFYSGW